MTVARMVPASPVPPSALSVHRGAVVVDLHNDVLLQVQSGKRDITQRSSVGHSDLPRLREGGVDVQLFALFVHPKDADRGFARVTELLDAFDRLVAAARQTLRLVTSVADIEHAHRAGRLAVALAIENGSALGGDPARLDAVYQRGVRMLSLTWNNSNDLADGALESQHGGLTDLGRRVVQRMQELRIVVDVSHLSEKSFWDVLETTRGPVVATHSNAAAVTSHPRNLSDEQLRAVARRAGVVGVNFYPTFTGGPTLERILDHIAYMIELMGPDHVALGSDFDGFDGQVTDLEDVARLPRLTAGLMARGYPGPIVQKVLGQNALRVFRAVWGR